MTNLAATATYLIPAENLADLTDKLAKLNKRAAKIGTTPIAFTSAHDHTDTWTEVDAGGYERERATEWLKIELTGAVAVVAGHRFIAAIHHTDDGNIIAKLPTTGEMDPKWRTATPMCDHCGVLRARNSTYLLEDATTGALKQVGRQCLKDFTGLNDPFAVATWAEQLGAFAEYIGGMSEEARASGGRGEAKASLLGFLVMSATVIRLDGWVSKAEARDSERPSTAGTAWSAYWATERYERELVRRYQMGHTDGDKELARAAQEWVRTLIDKDGLNDYLYNLSVVARAGLVTLRTSGLAASIVSAYRRTLAKAEEAKRAADRPASTHVGTIGERLRGVKVTLVAVRDLPPSDWGSRSLVTMADEAGNDLVWFATGFGNYAQAGDVRWLTGTVKAHGEFNGRQQTTLTRCDLATEAPPVKAPKTPKRKAGK